MARYKLLVKAENGVCTQWIEKPDGSHYGSNEKDITFIVESKYENSVYPEDLLKQNGLKWRAGFGRPSELRNNVNGWHIQIIQKL